MLWNLPLVMRAIRGWLGVKWPELGCPLTVARGYPKDVMLVRTDRPNRCMMGKSEGSLERGVPSRSLFRAGC